ncbi:T9SS type A sorting domain-containing protein [Crocinitomix catalasitica]|uniref:T9SS type A sorting domain-containing protein n=1 Tax=Crocinitomix catalasitica TaxID=184607 RepID=UPI000481F569|nr:T9SS type A sorting domain-containing protein [Crocinitomix catalasitica]
MKYAILFISITLSIGTILGQTTFVPDDNFEQALIDLGLDDELDDYVLTSNIDTLTALFISRKAITSLEGIEDFIYLEILDCSENNLNLIDLSANLNLINFSCSNNTINRIEIGINENLKIMNCSANELTTFDITGCPELQVLICDNNLITSLDLTINTELIILKCNNNNLTNLILDRQLNIRFLECELNPIRELNVTNNTNLRELKCGQTDIKNLNLDDNTSLMLFNAYNGKLETLSIRNSNNYRIETSENFNIRENPNLFCVSVDNVDYATSTWTEIDESISFSENCHPLNILPSIFIDFTIYPNPAKSYLTIATDQAADQYNFYDLSGKQIRTGKLNQGSNTIELDEFSPGIYMLNIVAGDLAITEKIIIE